MTRCNNNRRDFLKKAALTAAGLPLPKERPLDGVDLLPFLSGERQGAPHEFLCWQIYFGSDRQTGQAAIRSGKWKLHQHAPVSTGPDPNRWQLYDLATDPGEERDMVGINPDIVQQLAEQWTIWRAEMADLEPSGTTGSKKKNSKSKQKDIQ